MSMEQHGQEPTLLDAMNEIAMIRQSIRVQPLDSKPNALEGITARLTASELTPAQAIREAHRIAASMQDYK